MCLLYRAGTNKNQITAKTRTRMPQKQEVNRRKNTK